MADCGVTFSPRKNKSNRYCSVPQCNSKARSHPELRFNRFPPPGQMFLATNSWGLRERCERRKIWTNVLKIGKRVSNTMLVCSRHFKKDDYILPDVPAKTRCLKKTAVPSCNLPVTSFEKLRKERNSREQTRHRSRTMDQMHKSENMTTDHSLIYDKDETSHQGHSIFIESAEGDFLNESRHSHTSFSQQLEGENNTISGHKGHSIYIESEEGDFLNESRHSHTSFSQQLEGENNTISGYKGHSSYIESAESDYPEESRLSHTSFSQQLEGDISTISGHSIKRKISEAYKIVKAMRQNRHKDDYDLYGELLARKLRKLDQRTRIIVMNDIDNLIFRATVNNPTNIQDTTVRPDPSECYTETRNQQTDS